MENYTVLPEVEVAAITDKLVSGLVVDGRLKEESAIHFSPNSGTFIVVELLGSEGVSKGLGIELIYYDKDTGASLKLNDEAKIVEGRLVFGANDADYYLRGDDYESSRIVSFPSKGSPTIGHEFPNEFTSQRLKANVVPLMKTVQTYKALVPKLIATLDFNKLNVANWVTNIGVSEPGRQTNNPGEEELKSLTTALVNNITRNGELHKMVQVPHATGFAELKAVFVELSGSGKALKLSVKVTDNVNNASATVDSYHGMNRNGVPEVLSNGYTVNCIGGKELEGCKNMPVGFGLTGVVFVPSLGPRYDRAMGSAAQILRGAERSLAQKFES